MEFFRNWPLNNYLTLRAINKEIEDKIYYYVDKDIFIRESEIEEEKRKSEKYYIVGKRKTINKIYKEIREGRIPEIPEEIEEKIEEKREKNGLYMKIKGERNIDRIIERRYPEKMKYIGPSIGGISWNGVATDILKSAIQKYVRRGLLEKANWCLVELDLFSEILFKSKDKKLNKSVRGFQTNVVNRLIIMTCEDVSIGNPFLPILMEKLFKEWSKVREDINNREKRRKILLEMTINLVKSQKSRELSHLKTAYYQIFESDISDDFIDKYPEIYNFSMEGDSFSRFKIEFDNNRDACFYWFFKVLFQPRTKSNTKKTSKSTKSQKSAKQKPLASSVKSYIDYVISKEKDKNILALYNILNKWFTTKQYQELWIYGTQIILLALRRPFDKPIFYPVNSNWSSIYLNNVMNKSIIIYDYCIDKHTRAGKKLGKTTIDFALEGSLVENESILTNQIYKKIYVQVRTFDSHNPIIRKDIEDEIVYCDILSSDSDTDSSDSDTDSADNFEDNSQNSRKKLSKELPKKVPKKVSKESPKKVPKKVSKESPKKIPKKVSKESPKKVSKESPKKVPKKKSKEQLKKVSTGKVYKKSAEEESGKWYDKYISEQVRSKNSIFNVLEDGILDQNDIDELLSNETPRGQILTGGFKKYTYIPKKGKFYGYVIKGPWKSDKKSKEKLDTIFFRAKSIIMAEGDAIIQEFVPDINDNIWFVSKNLATTKPDKWKITFRKGALEPEPIPTIDQNRSSLGYNQLSGLEYEEQYNYLFGDQMLFKTLILMAVLGTGDMGPWNILVSNDYAYIVDSEDNSGRTSIDIPTNFFSKTKDKQLIQLVNRCFKNTKSELLSYCKFLKSLLPMLKNIASDWSVKLDLHNNFSIVQNFFDSYSS